MLRIARHRSAALVAAIVASWHVAAGALEVTVDYDADRPEIEFESPDLSGYTVAAIRELLPEVDGATVRLAPTEGEPLLAEAVRRERGEDLRRRQGAEQTEAIFVTGGVASLGQVVEELSSGEVAEQDGRTVTLRRPLVVGPGATLIIDGRQTPEVRLSTDRGAFLINGGRLFIVDAEVTAWDEERGASSEFVEKSLFRPFIASMIRSETYLAGSHFRNLGYAQATAYGLSLSTQPERRHGEPTDASPMGVLVGNTFESLYYGFYSYEARDVAIVDNVYRDCVVYGIDPHDRTTRLLIASNTATGTRERHGIIGSRGVSDSVIVDNDAFGNAGSGVMLDRECRDIVVAGNRVYDNGQGVAIYESSAARVIKNLIASNESSGLRVRNSVDILVADNTITSHGDYAFDITAKRLKDHEKRVARGDTYDEFVNATVYGTRTSGNRGFAKGAGFGVLRVQGVMTSVDPDSVSADLDGFAFTPRYAGRDREFGGELKPVRDRLAEVFASGAPLVSVTGDTPAEDPR